MSDFLSSSTLPEAVRKQYNCRLIHSRVPYMTGKMIYSEHTKEWVREVIWVCKEGCDDLKKGSKDD